MPTAAIVGGGVIGSGWAARFLLNGWDVRFFDPSADADRVLQAVIDRGREAMPALSDRMPSEGTLHIAPSTAEAVLGASYIQESTPERIEVKQAVFRSIQEACDEAAIVASSTSGFMPTELQEGALRPEQIIVSHPYNPVYLLPLVEVVASPKVPTDLIQRTCDVLESVSMKPIVLVPKCLHTLGTDYLKRCGARPCGWSKTGSRRRGRSTISSRTALAFAGRRRGCLRLTGSPGGRRA